MRTVLESQLVNALEWAGSDFGEVLEEADFADLIDWDSLDDGNFEVIKLTTGNIVWVDGRGHWNFHNLSS